MAWLRRKTWENKRENLKEVVGEACESSLWVSLDLVLCFFEFCLMKECEKWSRVMNCLVFRLPSFGWLTWNYRLLTVVFLRLHHIYPPFTGSEKRSNYTKDASLSIKRSQIHGNIVHCINKHQQEGATVIIIFASCSSDFLEHQCWAILVIFYKEKQELLSILEQYSSQLVLRTSLINAAIWCVPSETSESKKSLPKSALFRN